MTALEFLIDKICGKHTDFWKKEIQEALEMEKQQIIEAYKYGNLSDVYFKPEQYYSETYKKDNQ